MKHLLEFLTYFLKKIRKWRAENGKWKVESGKWKINDHPTLSESGFIGLKD